MSTLREITYSTGETSKLTGASHKQIIYWEKKGFIPKKVERNICGDIAYRRFTQSQVEIIRVIKEFLGQGYTLARAAELAGQELCEKPATILQPGANKGHKAQK